MHGGVILKIQKSKIQKSRIQHFRLQFLTRSALFAALLCLLCPLAIPLGPIPLTLASFVVLLTACILPRRQAVCAVILYILLGAMGLPVFSGGRAGLGVLFGATGGFIWSYAPMATLAAAGRGRGLHRQMLCASAALLVCYACGALQYALVSAVDAGAALSACVLPFLPIDVLKLICACILGEKIRSRLLAAGLM